MAQLAQKGNWNKGDVELYGNFQQDRINGRVGAVGSGADYEVEIGDIVSLKTGVTPTYYGRFAGGDKRPFYLARGRRVKSNVGYNMNDSVSYKAKLETDATFSGIASGITIVDIDGTAHPGFNLTPVEGGKKLAEYAGGDFQLVAAIMLGAPGQRTGEYQAQAVTNGLAIVRWVGGV